MNLNDSITPVGNRELAASAVAQNGAPVPLPEAKVNILLVDDRSDKLLALEAILASLNQNLIQVHSGKEALRQLLKLDFAVILLDVSMPGMDGFETASLIRKRINSEHTPIIFITAIGNSENHIAKGYQLGAVDYMLAPIIPEILRTKVSVFVELYKKTGLIQQQAEALRRDLAARQRAEEQISQLNRQLEQRVTALTEINRELEAFSYSISHDLRAPLRSMSSFAQAVLEDEGDKMSPQGLDYAKRIARSAKYMDTLLHDLLTYSRLTREETPPSSIRLEDIVNDVLTLLEGEIRSRATSVEIVSPLGTVFAHLPTLKQILANLIGNGLKFVAPDRPARLRISTTRDQDFVRLSVEDNGIGIAPEHHQKIFGLFQRLHDAQSYPGTGIGLALVRKGAERMGGRAGVESNPGQGSRFWVDLPAMEKVNGE
jgi:two-component system sensor histidine kinase/response regulator